MDAVRVLWREVPEPMPRRDVARQLLQEFLPGARPTQTCPRCGGPHGPLRLHGVEAVASVTYAATYAVLAVACSDAFAAIGVDAEVDAEEDAADSGSGGVPRAGQSPLRPLRGRIHRHPRCQPAQGTPPTPGTPGLDNVLRRRSTLRDWVRVEAVLKADGRGLRVDPSLVDVRPAGDGWMSRVTDRPDIRYDVHDLDGPAGVLVSVALRPA